MPRRAARPQIASAPDRGRLHEAALAHLSRYSATRAGLIRVLERKVDRWARTATGEQPDDQERIGAAVISARSDIRALVDRLVEAGAVNDENFASGRAQRLSREGKSKIAIAAHLVSRGIAPEIAKQAVPTDEDYEVGAALALARRRRLGPFSREPERDAAAREKERAILARGGFPRSAADRALAMDLDEAEGFLHTLRHA